MSLTLEEVRRVRFRMARRGATGYEVGDVDEIDCLGSDEFPAIPGLRQPLNDHS